MTKQRALKAGFTYDGRDDYLAQGFSRDEVREFDPPETLDAIEAALRANGYEVERIGNIKALVKALALGKRWDFVFNIAEGVKGLAREAQVPALLEAYDIPYTFSSAEVMATTLDKSTAKRIVQGYGLPTPRFFVAEQAGDEGKIDLPFPLFVKPVGEGSSKGITDQSVVRDRDALRRTCRHIIETYRQPALVEEFLTGREFTVGIFCSRAECKTIGAVEISYAPGGQIWLKPFGDEPEGYQPPSFVPADDDEAAKACDLALACAKALQCRGVVRIDIRMDASGQPFFLEANTLPNLHPGSSLPSLAHSRGIDYNQLVKRIVENSLSFYEEDSAHADHSHRLQRRG